MSEQPMQIAKKRTEAKTEKDKYVRKELNDRELLEKKQGYRYLSLLQKKLYYNKTCKRH